MFIPNRTCLLRKKQYRYDVYGQAKYSDPVVVKFALVRFDLRIADTTVRADSSATRGNVQEFQASGRILIEKKTKPEHGDLVIFDERIFRIREVEPRYNVMGKLDHYECDLEKSEDNFKDEK